MRSWGDAAVEDFRAGFACSQAVLTACAGGKLSRAQAQLVSSLFGGGIAHRGELCGAISGAIMAVGLYHGKTDDADDRPAGERIACELIDRFRGKHGGCDCRELTGLEMSDPVQRSEFKQRGLRETRCEHYVRDAADWLEELLNDTTT